MKYILLLLSLYFASCGAPNNKNEASNSAPKAVPKGYHLTFAKIDNKVNVYIDEELIFNSGAIQKSPDLDIEIELTPYIKTQESVLKIELFNGNEPYNDQLDPAWEVRYELFFNAETLDFIHEINDNHLIGKVLEISYILKEEQAFRRDQ